MSYKVVISTESIRGWLLALLLASAVPGCATQAGTPAAASPTPPVAAIADKPSTDRPRHSPCQLSEVRGGFYRLGNGMYDMMFLVHADGVIVVDAPPLLGPYIVPAVRTVTTKPLTHLGLHT
jgi:hypothetical protein